MASAFVEVGESCFGEALCCEDGDWELASCWDCCWDWDWWSSTMAGWEMTVGAYMMPLEAEPGARVY